MYTIYGCQNLVPHIYRRRPHHHQQNHYISHNRTWHSNNTSFIFFYTYFIFFLLFCTSGVGVNKIMFKLQREREREAKKARKKEKDREATYKIIYVPIFDRYKGIFAWSLPTIYIAFILFILLTLFCLKNYCIMSDLVVPAWKLYAVVVDELV